MKVSILTLGCKVNQAESCLIGGSLVNRGFSIVTLSDQPDYCIVNTCTVTAKSDYQSRQLIRRAVRAGAKVIVTGCYSQLRNDEIQRINGNIDIVKNNDKLNIINMLTKESEECKSYFSFRSRPYIKIQDGCNSACAYCIVPKARGKSRSLEVSEILQQALAFESRGYNEIVLTGINIGFFGKDLKPKIKLSDILITLLEKTTIQRIRLSSIELSEIGNELIELLKEERICRHLHIPLQSGDDAVLKRMDRSYSAGDYVRIIESIITKVPGIAIGTDIIVGFPGESEKEFSNTRELLASLPLSYMHIFPFSPRPDTPAFKMSDQIAFISKRERYNELNSLNTGKKIAYMSSQMNKILDVIIEERCDDQTMIGTSSNYLKIKVCSNGYPRKSLVHVRVSEREGNILKGFPIVKP